MLTQLEKLGFTVHEARVYLEALKMGPCTVIELSSATGLNRITVHSIVERFEGQKIFERTYEGKRRRVFPVAPESLSDLLEQKEQAIKEQQEALTQILPELSSLFVHTRRGLQTRIFQGVKGYQQMAEDALNAKTEMLQYANIDELYGVLGSYISTKYLPKKRKKKFSTRFLFIDTPFAREYIAKNYIESGSSAKMEAKFISSEEFDMKIYFVIYDDKVSILSPQTLDGVIIQDQAISSALRPFFNFVWKRAGQGLRN